VSWRNIFFSEQEMEMMTSSGRQSFTVNEFMDYSRRLMVKSGNLRTLREFWVMGVQVLNDIFQFMATRATFEPSTIDETIHPFWMCRTMCAIYVTLLLALVTQRLWILHGVSIILFDKILQVVLKWIVFILDDDELWFTWKYFGGWFGLIIREGEKTLSSPAAWKYAVAYSAVMTVPTGVSYVRFIARYKMKMLHKDFVQEIGVSRFGKRESLQIKLSKVKQKTSSALKSSLHNSFGSLGRDA
jgi:hypothetical protein